MFFELVSFLFAIVPNYGNKYMAKENKKWTSFKNFATKLNLNHIINIKYQRMKDVLYEVGCLKSNEDMILALTGQFKQLSHEPEKFRWLNGIRTHDLCDAGAVL